LLQINNPRKKVLVEVVGVGKGNITGNVRNGADKPKIDDNVKDNEKKTYLDAVKSTDIDET
jgi:hypothetical protein